jgi:CrcB protein
VILAVVVGVAGGIGAVTRYLVDGAVQDRTAGPFPHGTLVVNVTGSLVLGVLAGMAVYHGWDHGFSEHVREVAGVGFCGGLTTWSTASWETVRLAEGRLYRQATAYTFGGLALAIVAAAFGMALASL